MSRPRKKFRKAMFEGFADEIDRLARKERGAELDDRDPLSPFRRMETDSPDARRGIYGHDPVGYRDRGIPI